MRFHGASVVFPFSSLLEFFNLAERCTSYVLLDIDREQLTPVSFHFSILPEIYSSLNPIYYQISYIV